VWRDAADHACIPNLPFHDEHPQASQDIATDLADAAEILTAEQFEEAKELWAVRDANPRRASARVNTSTWWVISLPSVFPPIVRLAYI
jgi:hypothetical protein